MPTSTNPVRAGTPALDSASSEKQPEILRSSRGRFAPGQSGNPRGRIPGEFSSLRLRLKEDADSVAEVIVGRALAGDMFAAKLVMDRVLAPLRETAAPITVELPPDSGPYPMADAVLRAALAGTISPDTAAQLVGVASQLSRIAEVEEFKARLDALERAVTGNRAKA